MARCLALLLALLALFAAPPTASAFYLPGVAPQDFARVRARRDRYSLYDVPFTPINPSRPPRPPSLLPLRRATRPTSR